MTQQKTQRIEEFRGIDNKSSYNNLVEQDRDVLKVHLKEAVNVDVLNSKKIVRRTGAEQLVAGEHHSLWARPAGDFGFVVNNRVLGRIDADLTFTPYLPVSDFLAYGNANHEVFISDNTQMIVYDSAVGAFALLTAVGTHVRNPYALDMAEEAVYCDSPPPGYALEFWGGRLLVGNQYGLFYSKYGYPRRFDSESGYVPFEDLTIIGAVDDGIYVGTKDKVYYLGGSDIKKQNFKLVSHYGAVRGTLLHTEANKFGIDGAMGRAVIWETKEGKVLGLNSGRVFNLTQDHVSYPVAQLGASLLREMNGQIHHISTFINGYEAHNPRTTDIVIANEQGPVARPDREGFGMSDVAEAEVRRNGVII